MADINPNALLEFARTITSGGQSKGGARLATVTRVDENGVAYVQLPGGEESPIGTTGATYNIGDVVSVSMYGGKLRTIDNISAPSVSERVVKAAIKPISKAADLAKKAASEADKVATAINQHFWADDNGIHVTEADHDATTEHNILINSLGILLRKASNYLVSITQIAVTFYDGLGNAAANVVAQFGTNGAQIGYADETHAEIDYHSLKLVDKEGSTYFNISDLRGTDGTVSVTDDWTGDGSTVEFFLSCYAENDTYTVYVDGVAVTSGITKYIHYFEFSTAPQADAAITASYTSSSQLAKGYTLGIRGSGNVGSMSISEGYGNVASNVVAHAEGYSSQAIGFASHAEGEETTAHNRSSHSEGRKTIAGKNYSHAEGWFTTADGVGAHSEGGFTTASGNLSHAEGAYTTASGAFSHAQNYYTKASSNNQTAIGKYNVEDTNEAYALIIGNGTADNARSNALAVMWDGTQELANGSMIWDNSNNNIHIRTPDESTSQAEFSLENDGKIYTRKRTRSSTSASWGSWSTWAAIN